MKTAVSLLFIVALLHFRASLAQEQPSHWLIGRWRGSIENYSGKEGPLRTLRVTRVSPDGAEAIAVWSVSGEQAFWANVTLEGSQVKIVTNTKSVVELTREGDESLVGKLKWADGQEFSIKFRKVKLSTEFDGEWQGNNPVFQGCGDAHYKITVKDSLVTGQLRILWKDLSPPASSAITGEVDADGRAVIQVRGARNSRFSGTFTSTEFRGSDPPVGNQGCSYEVKLNRR